MKIVIPIAGRGSRFQKASHLNPAYKVAKPLIDVKGYPMIRWATGSLPFVEHSGQRISGSLIVKSRDLVFIALKEHQDNFQIGDKLKNIYGNDINVIFLEQVTRGAAETVLTAKPFINNNDSLIVSDSDHFFDGQALARGIIDNPEIDGLIPVFRVDDGSTKWSYSRLAKGGFVDLVAEKQPISEWANIGAYYYKRGKDFVEGAEDMLNKNELHNNEFYVAPVYNKLIERGGNVKLVYPEYVYGLGTPADLEAFVKNANFNL